MFVQHHDFPELEDQTHSLLAHQRIEVDLVEVIAQRWHHLRFCFDERLIFRVLVQRHVGVAVFVCEVLFAFDLLKLSILRSSCRATPG